MDYKYAIAILNIYLGFRLYKIIYIWLILLCQSDNGLSLFFATRMEILFNRLIFPLNLILNLYLLGKCFLYLSDIYIYTKIDIRCMG
jgi:hypothetical protein